ncbi:hypothetical protein [Streptomyces avidinii]|uniref:Uncharacterized protein n=1 Tax=Streptomyces avidinii TaxID=1895 RepID=A0ABS4L5C2_STRAV|nr:hypothetical protein [Streptomyces avidinii]MBP2037304.1 hypothetical protein [Streptomyces avidinii]
MDAVRESAATGRVVLWEESARDDAQAKTLMPPGFRVELARATGRIFGPDGPRHVVFAAGFPAVCGEEFEAVRRVAREAEGAVGVAAVCRGARRDVEQAVASALAMFPGTVPVLQPPHRADGPVGGPVRGATTTVTVHPDGRLTLHRHGAQDRSYPHPDDYLDHLRARYGSRRSL